MTRTFGACSKRSCVAQWHCYISNTAKLLPAAKSITITDTALHTGYMSFGVCQEE